MNTEQGFLRHMSVAGPDLHPAKGGGGGAFEGLTINVEFCEDNSGGRSKKMRYFRKYKVGEAGAPGPGPYPGSATACSCIFLSF